MFNRRGTRITHLVDIALQSMAERHVPRHHTIPNGKRNNLFGCPATIKVDWEASNGGWWWWWMKRCPVNIFVSFSISLFLCGFSTEMVGGWCCYYPVSPFNYPFMGWYVTDIRSLCCSFALLTLLRSTSELGRLIYISEKLTPTPTTPTHFGISFLLNMHSDVKRCQLFTAWTLT